MADYRKCECGKTTHEQSDFQECSSCEKNFCPSCLAGNSQCPSCNSGPMIRVGTFKD